MKSFRKYVADKDLAEGVEQSDIHRLAQSKVPGLGNRPPEVIHRPGDLPTGDEMIKQYKQARDTTPGLGAPAEKLTPEEAQKRLLQGVTKRRMMKRR